MDLRKLAASLTMSGALAFVPQAALAQDEVDISNTGPGSTNEATINNNQDVTINNNQDVTVTNTNSQTATSGDANVSGNTTGGNATSGDASNSNTTSTVIGFADAGIGGGGTGGGGTGGGGTGGGGTGGGGGSSSGGTGGGSLFGMGGGLLPDTGASFPIDVSALRDALAGAAGEDLAAVNRNKGLSVGLLSAAALMSLLGAAGSAAYASRKEQTL